MGKAQTGKNKDTNTKEQAHSHINLHKCTCTGIQNGFTDKDKNRLHMSHDTHVGKHAHIHTQV